MRILKYILFYLLFPVINAFSQSEPSQFRAWQLTSFSGQANLKANYRQVESELNNVKNGRTDEYLNGIFQIRTQSFFVHPNFMLVNLNGIYNPETSRNKYIGVPDFSEKSNSQGLDASAVFFRKKNFNLTTNASIYNSIQVLDNLTRISNKNKYLGNTFSYFNNILPVTVSYSQQVTDQKTIDLSRTYTLDQRIFQGSANKSFSSRDDNSFTYMHTENTSSQEDLGFISRLRQFNKIDFMSLNDNLTIGSKKNFIISSSVANSDEKGTIESKIFSVQEFLTIKLPKHFVLANNYNLRTTDQELNTISYQRIQNILSHQLFESLNSSVMFEHWLTKQNYYKEQRNRIGIDLKYLKLIRGGKLIMSYSYYKEFQTVNTPPSTLYILHEEYTLHDNLQTLLRNQNVEIPSIVVRDISGTTTYQLNIDYLLIDENPYVEIVRIPGGLIANNSTVYLDYSVIKPGLYEYDMNNSSLNADAWLLNNKINIYYRLYTQDYSNQVNTENQALNILKRHTIGTRFYTNNLNGGIEYEYSKSNILPYSGMKYYLSFQKMYKKLNLTLNGNLTDYEMSNELSRRKDLDLRCNFAYSVASNIKINADYMYRSMRGRGIYNDIQTSKFEITTNLHLLFISFGADLYWSTSINTYTRYKGTYIQLTRNF